MGINRDQGMMQRFILLFACLLTTGCIYSHTVSPLTLNFHNTPGGDTSGTGNTKTLTYYVDIRWDINGIGAVARENGIDEIYYADLETLRILGYWRQDWVHVYGRAASPNDAEHNSEFSE